jgi:hypothetical protein
MRRRAIAPWLAVASAKAGCAKHNREKSEDFVDRAVDSCGCCRYPRSQTFWMKASGLICSFNVVITAPEDYPSGLWGPTENQMWS